MVAVELRVHPDIAANLGRILRIIPSTAVNANARNQGHLSLVDKFAFYRSVGELVAIFKALDAFECTAEIEVVISEGKVSTKGWLHFFREYTRLVAELAMDEVTDKMESISRRWPHCHVVINYKQDITVRTLI